MSKHPDAFWNATRCAFVELAERRTREAGRLGHCEAMRELHIGHRALLRIRDSLLTEGAIVDLGRNLGVAVPGIVAPTRTLSGVLRAAADRHSSSAKPRRGRRNADMSDVPATFSAAQLVKMRTAVSFLERADSVSGTHMTSGPFRRHEITEEWQLIHAMEHAADFRALGKASQMAYRSGLRLLLAFAEHVGLLGEAPPDIQNRLLPAEWVGWINARTADIGSSKYAAKEFRYGVRMLARLASARGWLSEKDVEWTQVLDDLTAARNERLFTNVVYDKVMRTYRRLHRAGSVVGPAGTSDRHLEVALVDQATLKRGAYELDYSEWRAHDGSPIPNLARELRRHHLWRSATVPNSRLRLEVPPLPSRAYGTGREAAAPFLMKTSSIVVTWNHLLHFAGWLVFRGFARPADIRLATLTDLDPWEIFVEESLVRRGLDPVDGANSSLSGVAQNLSVLADPYLAREAQAQGDGALAAEMVARGTFFRSESLRLQPTRGEFDGAREKVGAWESDGTSGYPKLELLRRLIVDDIERYAGGMAIAEQLACVRDGALPALTNAGRWAIAVRDYVMISILRRVPLRVSNLVGLQVTHEPPQRLRSRRNGDKCEWWVSDASRPWEGPITLRIAYSQSKNDQPAKLPLITRDDCGASDAEADLGRDVLELYLRPSGARALLLSQSGNTHATNHVLVTSSSRLDRARTPSGSQWRRAGASRRFTELVSRSCEPLGLERALLAATQGALGIHVVRHLFGSWFTEHEQLDFAATMLMHASTETLERHYRHLTPRALSIDKRRRRIA